MLKSYQQSMSMSVFIYCMCTYIVNASAWNSIKPILYDETLSNQFLELEPFSLWTLSRPAHHALQQNNNL